jgi:hypothetical protein
LCTINQAIDGMDGSRVGFTPARNLMDFFMGYPGDFMGIKTRK